MRIYVETSVWSFAFADDAPDYQADTIAFFDRCRTRIHEPLTSVVALEEIERATPALREKLVALVRDIQPVVVGFSTDAQRLANAFVRERAVPPAKPEDAQHVAIAFAEEADTLVSWNFRHIVSVRKADRFNAIALLQGFYKPLRIVTPAEVLYDDEIESP